LVSGPGRYNLGIIVSVRATGITACGPCAEPTRTGARLGANIIGELVDMAKDKIDVTLKLERNHLEWLNTIVDQYDLADESKAARVLFDYAIGDADHELVFANENARCQHCG